MIPKGLLASQNHVAEQIHYGHACKDGAWCDISAHAGRTSLIQKAEGVVGE